MWRFIHLSDPHLGSQRDGVWNNRFICSMMPSVISCLRKDIATMNPEFLLVTGDIASERTRDSMFAARDLLDSLGFPYYPSGGNHDFMRTESRDWFVEAFGAHLPNEDTVYSFDQNQLHFCVLDPWWRWSDGSLAPFQEPDGDDEEERMQAAGGWALPPHQFAWLDDDLRTHANRATVIATHYPLIPIPERMRRPGMRDAGRLANGDELRELLREHPQVKACFAGHSHMHYIEEVDGFMHIVTGALPEYPVEYRDVMVNEDHMDIRTCELSEGSCAARSLIPGHEWTRGEERDRTCRVWLA